MALMRGLFVRKDDTRGTTPVEARAALAGLVTPATVGGVLSGLNVTGTDGWAYQVGTGAATIVRGVGDGVIVSANDSAATVPCDPAPATGSRWDLIWALHHDVDGGDADSEAMFGVTSGTASGTPSKPYGAVPAGATVIAEANLSASATNTLPASITAVARRIVGRGGIHPVRDTTDRTALVSQVTAAGEAPSPTRPLYVHRADAAAGLRLEVNDGSGFRPVSNIVWSGEVTFGTVAPGAVSNVAFTFPVGLFSTAPKVVCTLRGTASFTVGTAPATTSGVTATVRNVTSSSSSGVLTAIAVVSA